MVVAAPKHHMTVVYRRCGSKSPNILDLSTSTSEVANVLKRKIPAPPGFEIWLSSS
jgi:hypothetical protein